jgi:hypothetical protein
VTIAQWRSDRAPREIEDNDRDSGEGRESEREIATLGTEREEKNNN